jgi:hypothetical protein
MLGFAGFNPLGMLGYFEAKGSRLRGLQLSRDVRFRGLQPSRDVGFRGLQPNLQICILLNPLSLVVVGDDWRLGEF